MINVGGKEFRTLADELFVNNRKVYKVYVGDALVYPEDDGNIYKVTRVFEYEGIVSPNGLYSSYPYTKEEAVVETQPSTGMQYYPEVDTEFNQDNPFDSMTYYNVNHREDNTQYDYGAWHYIHMLCNIIVKFKIVETITTNFPLKIIRVGTEYNNASDGRTLYTFEKKRNDFDLVNYNKVPYDYIVIDKVNDSNNNITVDINIECEPVSHDIHLMHRLHISGYGHEYDDPVIDINCDKALESLTFNDHFILTCNFDKVPLLYTRKFFNIDELKYFSNRWDVEIVGTDGVNSMDDAPSIDPSEAKPYHHKDTLWYTCYIYEDKGKVPYPYSDDHLGWVGYRDYGTDNISYSGYISNEGDELDSSNADYYTFPSLTITRSNNNSPYAEEDTCYRMYRISSGSYNRLGLYRGGPISSISEYLLLDDPFILRDYNIPTKSDIMINDGIIDNFTIRYGVTTYSAISYTTSFGYNGFFLVNFSPIPNGGSLNNFDGILDFNLDFSEHKDDWKTDRTVRQWAMLHLVYKSVKNGYGRNYVFEHDEYSTNNTYADFIPISHFTGDTSNITQEKINTNLVDYKVCIPEIVDND